MTQEALKLALDALIWTTGSGDFGEGGYAHEGAKKCLFPAITAIQEALAQTQEPVAWIHNFIDGGISIGKRPADLKRHPDRWTALYKDPKPCPTCEALARTVMLDQTSHDTTPPQRTEQNFCSRCGKRTKDLTHIHTCTPPQD
jgi:hypothetical protein